MGGWYQDFVFCQKFNFVKLNFYFAFAEVSLLIITEISRGAKESHMILYDSLKS